eukprot:scaffold1085_cov407-Prasinococcus_capsulatus_cf.AAC.1
MAGSVVSSYGARGSSCGRRGTATSRRGDGRRRRGPRRRTPASHRVASRRTHRSQSRPHLLGVGGVLGDVRARRQQDAHDVPVVGQRREVQRRVAAVVTQVGRRPCRPRSSARSVSGGGGGGGG